MLILRNLPRFFHTSITKLAVEKSALAALRKKTGYTFANCKKALEMHNNDVTKAEQWLKEQAQALGWSKATKLEGRTTAQGLIGVAIDNRDGVLVEVNCETDFVARNVEFEKMVKEATEVCLNHLKASKNSAGLVTKVGFDTEQLRSLKGNDGKSLADKLALMIGNVGENATLKRAVGIKVSEGIHLAGYAHPSGKSSNNILLGRIGSILAIKSVNPEKSEVEELGKGLCQHIVGMAPKTVGKGDEKPATNKEEEIILLHQDYLLDDSMTVKEILEENQVAVVDFKRFECGETTNNSNEEEPQQVKAEASQ
ncbi:elongation factor Ts, mitochondrial isoform X2 [Anthonomus grandis grandis]|uniref:elongation factor Ts, mitochondrial isoform X2 n=1 Tax=Anthonomus grandis grandis TaxID=2921223 RepID=UPI002164FD79|nr:elongation factor Ts, mitochondrial isoform X2 [Anthonomus grandis grandis]